MRKSFTRFLSVAMLIGVFITTSLTSVYAQYTEPQSTATVKVEDAGELCYNVDDSYKVKLSVQDFVLLDAFELELDYNEEMLNFKGATLLSGATGLPLTGLTVTPQVNGTNTVLVLAWDDNDNTTQHSIQPNDEFIPFVELEFGVVGYPNNTATSYVSSLNWVEANSAFYWKSDATTYEELTTDAYENGTLNIGVNAALQNITFDYDANAVCHGSDVDVTILPAGQGYSYQLNGETWESSNIVNVQVPSTNTIRVKDANGCVSLITEMTMGSLDPVAFTVDFSDALCNGGNGTVTVDATGGSGDYTYYVVPSEKMGIVMNNYQYGDKTEIEKYAFAANQFTRVAGDYYVAVQDGNGCVELLEDGSWDAVTIDEPTPIGASIASEDATCVGGNGSITLTTSNGGTPWEDTHYMVSVNNGTPFEVPVNGSNVWAEVKAGVYNIAVTDSFCTQSFSVTIEEPVTPEFTVDYLDVACNTEPTGEIWINTFNGEEVTGPSAEYTFKVYDAEGTMYGVETAVGEKVDELYPNYYSVFIYGGAICDGDSVAYINPDGSGNTVPVMDPGNITFALSSTHITCHGDADGTITVSNITNVTNPEFSLDKVTWQESPVFEGLAANTYTVSVRDADNTDRCVISLSIDVAGPAAPLTVFYANVLAPSCPDGNDGRVDIYAEGGMPFYNSEDEPYYMYAIDESPNFVMNPTFAVTEGEHTIHVKDAYGCIVSTTFDAGTLEPTTIEADAAFITCFGDSTVIDVTLLTETYDVDDSFYTYKISTTEGASQSGTVFTPGETEKPAGTYYISAKHPNGCWSNEYELVVEQNPELELVSVDFTNATCNDFYDGEVTIVATGGTAIDDHRYEYYLANNPDVFEDENAMINWFPFFNETGANDSTHVTQVQKGTFYVGVKDACGAIVVSEAITVEGYDAIDATAEVTPVTCYDDEDGTITVTSATGGNEEYLYTLLVGEGELIGDEMQASGEYTGLAAGIYTLIVNDTSDPACPPKSLELEVKSPLELTVALDSINVSCFDREDGAIIVDITGGIGGTYGLEGVGEEYETDGKSYKVTINNISGDGTDFGTYTFQDGENYKLFQAAAGTYTVLVTDANGCTWGPETIEVAQPDEFVVETILTLPTDCNMDEPNGSIKVELTGGWEGYAPQVSLDDSGVWYDATIDGDVYTYTFDDLDYGTYEVSYRIDPVDALANKTLDTPCEYSVTETLTLPSPFTFDVEIENVSCHNGTDGKMIITNVAGGNGTGYQFQLVSAANPVYQENNDDLWEPNAENGDELYVTSFTFDTLSYGHYKLYIRDNEGVTLGACMEPESFEVHHPDTLMITETKLLQDVTCHGGNDGSIEIMATGGSGSYMYAITESNLQSPTHPYTMPPALESEDAWQASAVFEDLESATYIAWVIDANDCFVGGEFRANNTPIDQHRVVIDQPDAIDLEDDGVVDATCYGVENGKIYIDGTMGGNGAPYTYKVEGTNYAGMAVSYTFDNDGEGYTGAGATLSGVYASIDDSSTVIGMEDMYAVIAVDKLGCESDPIYVAVDQPEEFIIDIVVDEDAFICANDLSGIVDIVTVQGGTPAFEYQVYRDDVLVRTWTENNTHVLESGHEYVVEARDLNGCMAYDTLFIETPEPVVIADITDLTCYGEVSPRVLISATAEEGRTMMVRYQKVEGASTVGPWSEWVAFNETEGAGTHLYETGLTYGDNNESDGHYNFQVKDGFGCMSEVVFETFVPVQNELKATFTVDGTVMTITGITGGIAPYMLVVNGEAQGEVTGDVVVDSLMVGENVIEIMDAHKCTAVQTATLEELTVTAAPESGGAMDAEFQVVLTFNREVTIAEGDITGGTVTPGTGTEFTVTMTGNDGEEVSLVVGSTIMDLGGNAFAGATFTYTVGDNTAPMIETYSPVDGATLDDNHPTLEATFNENVVFNEAGNVYITKVGSTTPILTIPVTADMVDGNMITVTYDYDAEVGGLNKNTEYYVTFDAAIVADEAGNAVEGLADDTVWNFTTGDFATGVEDPVDGSLEFKVYPNPFDSYVTVRNADKLSRVIITNVAGQRVKEVVNPTETIQTGDLRSGIYVITLVTKDDVVAKTERIVKR